MKIISATLVLLIFITLSLQARMLAVDTLANQNSQNIGGQTQQKPQLNTDKDKISYIIGFLFGGDLKKEQIEMDTTIFLEGFMDALSGRPSLLPDSTMNKLYAAFSDVMNAKKMMIAKELSDKNKKEGDAFFAENKMKDSVVTLPSGLQYKILREGTGILPTQNDTVVAHYRGWFLDGKEFDNSYKRGEPATFLIKGIIKGWGEALQLMKVGSKWQLFIPPSLGYGERGYGKIIEPNSVLLFEVELLDVKKGIPTAPDVNIKPTPKKDAKKEPSKDKKK